MKRFTDGLRTLIHGFFSFDTKAWGATFLGGVFYFVIQMPLSVIFALFTNNYEQVEPILLLVAFILTLPVIDIVYDKMGGKRNKKIVEKETN